jgi:hypothetical protein
MWGTRGKVSSNLASAQVSLLHTWETICLQGVQHLALGLAVAPQTRFGKRVDNIGSRCFTWSDSPNL